MTEWSAVEPRMNAIEREWGGTGANAILDPATGFVVVRVHSRLT
jgi:hypothetical protein